MSLVPWSDRGKIDALTLTDIFMRRTPSRAVKNQEIPFSDVQAFLQGSALEIIASEADLPPTINGFHTLDPTKDYLFTEPGLFFDPILVPAGYIGFIKSSFLKTGTITYLGAGSFINTLNINGTIISISDAGGGAITVTTSAAHGLLDGQFVNIIGTTSYNQPSLAISNASGSVFDVQIPFVADESGFLDTGYEILQISDIDFTNPFTANLFDLTSTGSPATQFILNLISEVGFLSPGIIRNSTAVTMTSAVLAFITDGLILDNCPIVTMLRTQFVSLDPSFTAARGLILQGARTVDVIVDVNKFGMADPAQRPIRVDSSIGPLASVVIQNSPDNLVATDYYDTSAGGLDQTDPRVTALNNGTRANSMSLAEARSNGILEVDGSGGVDVPVVDITPVSGDWIQDTTTEEFTVDLTTGIVTYNGLKPISVKIEYSLSAAQTSGSAQTIDFDLHINGVVETKSIRQLVTSGVGNFLPVIYNGGNFDIDTGDTFQIFKDNTTNTNNTDIQNATMLITRN